MNPNEKLLLLFNKTQSAWEDATEKVKYIQEIRYYGNLSGYKVTFESGKTYPYNLQSIRIYTNPTMTDITNKDVIVDDELRLDIKKILKFGGYYKIFHNNGRTFLSLKVVLRDKIYNSEKDIFNYYKDLSFYAKKQTNSDDSIESFIYDQYQRITKVNTESALYAFITKKTKSNSDPIIPLFPFDFNMSQKNALVAALHNQVSIIEGPPGCGKTQVILNILMNLIYKDKKVAVVSNNNTAIRNVLEKLQEEHLDFLCALLGNKENKTSFFLEQYDISSQKEYFKAFEHYNPDILRNFILRTNNELLDTLHQKENDLARQKILLSELEKEYEHYQIRFKEIIESPSYLIKNRTSEEYLKAKIFVETTQKWNWINRFKLKWKYKLSVKWLNSLNNLVIHLENEYYKSKKQDLNQSIQLTEEFLKNNNFIQIKKKYVEKSKGLLFKKLSKDYLQYQKQIFTIDDYRHHFKDFTKQYPIILSTSHSLLSSIEKESMFDYLIVDEASQSELLSSVLAMSAAKNIIIVGDSKQLDQIDNDGLLDVSKKLADKYHVTNEYLYNDNSLLGFIKQVFDKAPVTLLKEHYRCHPTIINFLNQKFYDNQLIIMTEPKNQEPIELIQLVKGNHARRNPNGSGMYSQREIDEVVSYIKQHSLNELGIITPFRIQAEKFIEYLSDYSKIEVDTVHRFQGRQKDIIVLSTVVNSIEKTEQNERFFDFINNPKLFNVALSRAKHKVIMVGSEGVFASKNNHFADFIQYAKYQSNFTKITQATVTSVFDSLYESSNELYQNSHSLIITEKLILDLINSILTQYANLKVSMHVSLNKFIQSIHIFDETEQRYLNNNLTHVDFMIYNSITKTNMLAIEVDGIKYHEQNEKQQLRDRIKDKAFQVSGIPLLRLKTNGSEEKQQIESMLNTILGNII